MRWKAVAKDAKSIREDLEKLGIAPEFSRPVSEHLERFSDDLTADTYDAVLSGVALAHGVQRRSQDDTARPDSEEIQRLMTGFVAELKKLDEALEALAAYVTRMRAPAAETPPPDRNLH